MQTIQPHHPDFMRWPFDEIARLHKGGAVAVESTGRKVFLSYESVKSILNDKRFLADKHNLWLKELSARRGGELDTLATISSGFAPYLDPPVHTRVKRALGQVFRRTDIDAHKGTIESITRQALDAIVTRSEFDLVKDYSSLIPTRFIAHLMAIPEDDIAMIKGWADQLVKILYTGLALKQLQALNAVAQEFETYFLNLIQMRRENPGPDIISRLVELERSGELANDLELMSSCLFLFVAGQETTVKAVGNGMMALLSHPRQLEMLRERSDMIASATEEILRYDPPIVLLARIASEPMQLAGEEIEEGEKVIACLSAANHDPGVFSEPEVFNIRRREAPHVAFGSGIHTCVGAYLANVEIQIAVKNLIETLPDLQIADQDRIVWGGDVVTRGAISIPMKIRGS